MWIIQIDVYCHGHLVVCYTLNDNKTKPAESGDLYDVITYH